mmetsp:Transcript_20175/g.34457  ORF Transcript_20175/g.34457 Transcript_20175/m.34457 type:complete len:117 (-) Transcript_20175:202-552(-)
MKLLLQLFDFSLTQEVGERLLGALAKVLDERFKEAVVGDANYQMGDLTKKAILNFIDKEEYQFGDLTRAIQQRTQTPSQTKPKGSAPTAGIASNDGILAELDKWDQALQQRTKKKH